MRYRALSYPTSYLLRPFMPRLIRQQAPLFSRKLQDFIPQVFSAMDFKEAHLKALAKDVRFPLRAERYRKMTYTNSALPAADLVLPDTGLCFISGGRAAPFFQGEQPLEMIIFPRGPDLATVGHEEAIASLSGCLPQLVASCAAEFIVSHPDTPISDETINSIGASAAVLTEADMRAILDEIWMSKSLRKSRLVSRPRAHKGP